MWSLGATLYTAVEGRPPFDRDSAVATLAALVMDDPDTPERAGPLWPLIRSLLQRDGHYLYVEENTKPPACPRRCSRRVRAQGAAGLVDCEGHPGQALAW